MHLENTHHIRVRYSEIDAFGTYYNSRALEWFECGRTELCRSTGKPYTEWEADGVGLPLVESHVEYLGPATYDDELKIVSRGKMVGRIRLRFDIDIKNAATGQPVCRGYTIHAITDLKGKPIRPPAWVKKIFSKE
jgi:acyl-CoA thioester hydrolase